MKSNRNYLLLLASQFLSALGDNALIAVILGPLTFLSQAGQMSEQAVNSANARYSAFFFIPFILLAPLAGFLNDRFAKTTWLFGGNLIKLIGTGLGAVGLMFHADWQHFGYFIVGVGACCYSPAKYGILPEILPAERLVKANGTVEMLTLVGILGGLGTGAMLVDHFSLLTCYAIVSLIYGASLVFNTCMQRTPANPLASLNHSVGEFFGNLRNLALHPRLSRILFGTGLFWMCGATLRTNLQSWGLTVLKQGDVTEISNTRLSLLKLWMAVGIIIGSVLAGQLHKLGDLRRTQIYGWLMAAFILPLGLISGGAGFVLISALLLLAGASAGLFLVPLNASLQSETDHTKLGKTIATQNFIDYLAMLLGAGFVFGLSQFGFSAAQIFIALAISIGLVVIALRIPSAKIIPPTPLPAANP